MHTNHYIRLALAAALVSWTSGAYAQAIPAAAVPGPADAGRIEKREEPILPPSDLQAASPPLAILPSAAAPEQSKKIHLILKRVTFEGMHAFSAAEVKGIYEEYLDKDITLDTAWLIAAQLTTHYHDKGFFLSRAFVPQQQITNGEIHITVVEGYIAEVKLDDSLKDNSIIQEWVARLKAAHPISSDYLESVLLQLNDIPGVSLRTILEPVAPGTFTDGAVRMVLKSQEVHDHGQISYDNDGSKYLGPYEASAEYDTSIIPFQDTSLHFLTSTPARELNYGTLKQHIPVFAGGYLDVYGGYTKADPGYKLRPSDILSNSVSVGTSLSYQLIRQRQENLSTKLMFETRDTHSDILSDIPLTRDRIRALRAGLNYEKVDPWDGFNQFSFTVSQGLDIMDASEANDPNLSRPQAKPGFEKAEFTFSRSQSLNTDWGIITAAAGQIASGPLYSSEQFGYGGQAFGRAYDSSEIVGDHGIAGSVEMRYLGLNAYEGLTSVPYGFLDGGAVFNNSRLQEKTQAGSSAGFGLRFNTSVGASANVAVAFPIDQAIGTPIYGGGHDPRYTVELNYGF